MTAPPDDLDLLVDHLLHRLTAAAADPGAPWRTPMLASLAADGAPTLRTVVLRAVQPERRVLQFNTDGRSAKAEQIGRRPQVEFCFWDPQAAQQLRIAGDAAIETDGPAADAAWAALPLAGRAIYRDAAAPGTPIGAPGVPAGTNRGDGRQAFALVTVTWRWWDWIWLGPDSHRRARIRWTADGGRRAEWLVP